MHLRVIAVDSNILVGEVSLTRDQDFSKYPQLPIHDPLDGTTYRPDMWGCPATGQGDFHTQQPQVLMLRRWESQNPDL